MWWSDLITPDPKCDLDYVPGNGRSMDAEFAIGNSFGFGGINACLMLRRGNGHVQASA